MSEETRRSQPKKVERTRPSRAQRRREARKRKSAIPSSVAERSKLLQHLVSRAYPSYEFFLFAAFCGAILGLGYLLDSQAILVFGILMAPLLSPVVGMQIATVSGVISFFFKSFAAFLVGGVLVFITGALAGFAARIWMPLTFTEAYLHARLWWTDLIVLALGAILLAASFIRSEKKPFLPSAMVAYEILLPLNAAAFGLASHLDQVFLEGLLVFVVHLSWALLFGTLTLFFLGFRPRTPAGWAFSIFLLLTLIVALAGLMISGTNQTLTNETQPPSTLVAEVVGNQPEESVTAIPPTQTAAPTASSTPSPLPEASATLSVLPSPDSSAEPTLTATVTLTAEPTPLYARIASSVGGGAYLRREPGGPVILTLDNSELVEAMTASLEYDGEDWVQVRVQRDDQTFEGWIIQSVLETATPSPEW